MMCKVYIKTEAILSQFISIKAGCCNKSGTVLNNNLITTWKLCTLYIKWIFCIYDQYIVFINIHLYTIQPKSVTRFMLPPPQYSLRIFHYALHPMGVLCQVCFVNVAGSLYDCRVHSLFPLLFSIILSYKFWLWLQLCNFA